MSYASMTTNALFTAGQCLLALALTVGAAQALDVSAGGAAGSASKDDEEKPVVTPDGEPVEMSCGQKSAAFDIPSGSHSAVAPTRDDAGFLAAETELYDEIGMGRPSCNDSNCGVGQTCPAAGGSQTVTGGVKASWRAPNSRFVDLDIEPGTTAQLTCADCS